MKKYLLSAAALMALNLAVTTHANAQDKDTDKAKSKSKEKSGYVTKLDEYEEIVIKKKKEGNTKVTVEIKDGKVTIDGKPIDDFESDAVSVRTRKPARIVYGAQASPFRNGGVTINGMDFATLSDSTRPFLGVATNGTDEGLEIVEVTGESGAEKAGLKEDDIIVSINDKKLESPADLTTEVRKHKIGDKINITYKRDGKENKTTATLTKSKATTVFGYGNNNMNFNFDMPPAALYKDGESLNRLYRGNQNMELFRDNDNLFRTLSDRPRIGIRAQDTEESNGVKVLSVADESLADKAGIREGDIITSFDGKKISSADELSSAAREAREKQSIEVKFTRDGKAQTVEIRVPKKLKTTTL